MKTCNLLTLLIVVGGSLFASSVRAQDATGTAGGATEPEETVIVEDDGPQGEPVVPDGYGGTTNVVTPAQPAQPAAATPAPGGEREAVYEDPDDNPGLRIPMEVLGGILGYGVAFGLAYFISWSVLADTSAVRELPRISAVPAQFATIPLGALGVMMMGKVGGSRASFGATIGGAAIGAAVGGLAWLALLRPITEAGGDLTIVDTMLTITPILVVTGAIIAAEISHGNRSAYVETKKKDNFVMLPSFSANRQGATFGVVGQF